MGSFLTRTYLIKHPDKYDGVILSGTGHQSPALVLGGNAASSVMAKLNGAMGDGAKLDSLAFGTYLNKIENPRTKFDWLSRDSEQVDKYIADPRCGFLFTARGYYDMFTGLKNLSRLHRLAALPGDLPVLFISGDADPIGTQGKGVNTVAQQFRDAGVRDVTVRLYPGARHELFNETNRDEITAELIDWLNRHMK